MSIAIEIQRLQGAKSALKTAIEGKGVAVPSSAKIDGYSALVEAIEQGGGEGVWIIDNGNPEYVGSGTFQLVGLIKKLVIPDGYTIIPDALFRGNSSLEEVVMPDSILQLGTDNAGSVGTFRESGLQKITLSSQLQLIGRYAFAATKQLQSIILPQSLENIGSFAFLNSVVRIEGLDLPNVTIVGQSTFNGAINLTGDVRLPSLSTLAAAAFRLSGIERILSLGRITEIPRIAGGSGINYGSISGCTSLREVHLPDTMQDIGLNAFYGDSALTDVYVEAVTPPALGSNSFNDCPLEHIYVPEESVETYKAATNWNNFESIITAMPNP